MGRPKSLIQSKLGIIQVRVPKRIEYVELLKVLEELPDGERPEWIRQACLMRVNGTHLTLNRIVELEQQVLEKLDNLKVVEKPPEPAPTGRTKLKGLGGLSKAIDGSGRST